MHVPDHDREAQVRRSLVRWTDRWIQSVRWAHPGLIIGVWGCRQHLGVEQVRSALIQTLGPLGDAEPFWCNRGDTHRGRCGFTADEGQRERGREKGVTSDHRETRCSFPRRETTGRSRTDIWRCSAGPRERRRRGAGGRQMGVRIQLGTAKTWPDSTRTDHGVCARAEPDPTARTGAKETFDVARECARETRTGPNLTRGDLYSAFLLTPGPSGVCVQLREFSARGATKILLVFLLPPSSL